MKKYIIVAATIGVVTFFYLKNDRHSQLQSKQDAGAIARSTSTSEAHQLAVESEKRLHASEATQQEANTATLDDVADVSFSELKLTDGYQLFRKLEAFQKQSASERASELSEHFNKNKDNRSKVLWFASRTADVAYLPIWEDVLTRRTPLFGQFDSSLVTQEYAGQGQIAQIVDEQISALVGLEQIADHSDAKKLIERVLLNQDVKVHHIAREFAANRQIALKPSTWLSLSTQLAAKDPLRVYLRNKIAAKK